MKSILAAFAAGCLILLGVFPPEMCAQQYTYYSGLDRVFSDSTAIISENQFLSEQMLAKHNGSDCMEGYLEERHENWMEQVRSGALISDAAINAYFQEILEHILSNNPDIDASRIHFYISGATWPNAACRGDGNFTFNLGLLRRLENESQLAFVICHELAHYQLDHVHRAMNKSCAKLESSETKKKIREIRRMKYGARQEALRTLQAIVFDDRKHSRFAESAADSLGLVFLSNTRFDPHAAVATMAVLDASDEPRYDFPFEPHSLFPHPQFPVQPQWTAKSSGFVSGNLDGEFDKDSLKTHPDCNQRIGLLAKQLSEMELQPKALPPSDLFAAYREVADFERVEEFWRKEDLGATIFAAERLLHEYPNHPYLIQRIALSLYVMYEARKDHRLSDYLQMPSPHIDPEYNRLLKLLNRLRVSEMLETGHYYLEFHIANLPEQEEILATRILFAQSMDLETEALLRNYNSRYPMAHTLNKYQPQ